jgi:nickel superoxide dismutase
MNQLIENLKPGGDDKGSMDTYGNSFARYVLVKEEHAEIVKRETRIIWGDYFKPEHAEKYPELHQLVWDIMKLASKGRQEINMQAAQDLLGKLHRFAEIFWETKGVATRKVSSNQAAGGEYVVPA